MFADRQEFEDFRKSAKQKFLSTDTFNDYKKSLETRLKSIEEKLGKGFCLLAINFCEEKRDKGYRSILNVLKNLKDIEFEGFLPFIAFLSLAMFALYLICSITNWIEQSTAQHNNPHTKAKHLYPIFKYQSSQKTSNLPLVSTLRANFPTDL